MGLFGAAKEGVSEAIDNITGSTFARNVRTSVEELNNNMADLARRNKISRMPFFGASLKDVGLGGKVSPEKMYETINESMEGLYAGLGEGAKEIDKLKKMFAKGKWGDAEGLKKKVSSIIGEDSEIYKDFVGSLDASLDKLKPETFTGNNVAGRIGTLNYIFNAPKAYFNPLDEAGKLNKDVARTRKLTAFGAYAGVTVGGRFVKGGSLTKDQYGQKDIAGIPFI